MIDYAEQTKPAFRIVDGESPAVSFEHSAYIHGGIEIDTNRTVYFRSVSDCDLKMTQKSQEGELFFEDFSTHDLKLRRQKVWARQLNIENEGTHLLNENSDLWVLGYKTERGGTLLHTCSKAHSESHSEILGGFQLHHHRRQTSADVRDRGAQLSSHSSAKSASTATPSQN